MLKKNDFVIHPNMPEWGIRIIISNQQGDDVSVFFENSGVIKNLKQSFAGLEIIDDPGKSKIFLENILVANENKGVRDIQPFPVKVEKFLKDFKGGLYGPVLEQNERYYKQKAHEQFLAQLNKEDFKQLLDTEQWVEIADRIKKCHSINLLSKFEIIKFSDALNDITAQEKIDKGLFNLLYGKEFLHDRFDHYANILEVYDCNKWPIITLPLFLCYPEEHMFIKPTVTQEAALNRGFDIQYESTLNWNTYEKVILFSRDLFDRLSAYDNEDLRPRDMIDVQTFMWCTFTNGWSSDEIARAEERINT